MKEIGGYFELENLISNEYHQGLIRLNIARNALLYVLKAKNIRKLYIPYYLCNSISDMLIKNGYEFEYYNVDTHFNPVFNRLLSENEYLLVVNYFGQLTNEKVYLLKMKYKKIILDNTQAFYQEAINGIDTIYSCRKFFGVPDGAYLYTNKKLEKDLEIDVSKDRMAHLLGRFEGTASNYYSLFKQTDDLFKGEPLKLMSKLTENLLGSIDYEKVRSKRNENYTYLKNRFEQQNKLELVLPDGPFAYPLYVENGIEIRKRLAEKKIYIPTLWPNVLIDTPLDSIEYLYASNILPIPCDQRYGENEMNYLAESISNLI